MNELARNMRFFQLLLLASVFFSLSDRAQAKDGETLIQVFYKTKSVRVRPTQIVTGTTVDVRIRLRADGKVEDAFDIKGGNKGKSRNSLGNGGGATRFKVIDASTIARVSDAGNYINTLTVKVSGKNCSAVVERKLKPGQTLFKTYTTATKLTEFFSSIENEYTTCVIE